MNRQPIRQPIRRSSELIAAPLPVRPGPLRPASNTVQIRHQRWQMLDFVHGFKVFGLGIFFAQVFASHEWVRAYFEPKALSKSPGGVVLPFDASVRAARQASASALLLPQEKGLGAAAAFLHGAGIYLMTSPAYRASHPDVEVSAHCAHQHTQVWLESALRSLRQAHPELGCTFTAALEMGDFGGCDPEQVARLITARRLANLRVEQIWLGGQP